MSVLAPIVLFVYNRPVHTRKTIEALMQNDLANESDLFIISDMARSQEDRSSVEEVREYIKNIKGFKEITIIERTSNYGLARNIVEGVTEIISKYDKIIVLEDDIITSALFLRCMNMALIKYQNEQKVWHINGWSYPIDSNLLEDVYFIRIMNCWGWATWKDRWMNYNSNIDQVISSFNKTSIKEFDLNGSNLFWPQLINNREKKIQTWAIFWYATIFLHHGLCLSFSQSLTNNIGLDNTGTNSLEDVNLYHKRLRINSHIQFNQKIIESKIASKRIERYAKRRNSVLHRMLSKLKAITKFH